jgi:hypothetical protein
MLDWASDSRYDGGQRSLFLHLAFLAAAAAAVLKQTGMLWWPWFALIAAESLDERGIAKARRLWRPLLVSLALAAPWYAFNKYLILKGSVQGHTLFLITAPELYRGRTTFLGRLAAAVAHAPHYLVFLIPALRGLKVAGIRMVSASAVFMILSWLFVFSYSTRNARFPVMLSLYALGAMVEGRRIELERWGAGIAALTRSWRRRLLARPLEASLAAMAVLLAVSCLWGGNLDGKLLEARERSSLEIGETGLTKRVDWLLRRCPGKLLSADGRLRQLLSVDGDRFQFAVPTENFNPAEYQYLVLDASNKARVDPEALATLFFEDQKERRFAIYINKSALTCIYN